MLLETQNKSQQKLNNYKGKSTYPVESIGTAKDYPKT